MPMLSAKEKRFSDIALFLSVSYVIFYFIWLQFVSPSFYDPDSYYHAAVSNFIKNLGFHYQFHWAQFSTFKDFFSDKDFLFHLISLPFFYLTNNLILAGKYAAIFYNILFIAAFIFILKKYLPNFLVAYFLLFPLLSSTFSAYFLQFRSITLANIFTILAIYFLINKRILGLFIISLFYPLAHISFFTLIVFAFICEAIRYVFNKEIFIKNIYIVIIATLLGCFIHPNFPNNLLSLHLNGVLVPLYTTMGVQLDFGAEFNSPPAKFILINNFALFFTLNLILWTEFFTKRKLSLSTYVWFACFNVYFILLFFSYRYCYQATVLFFIFFASYVKDWAQGRDWNKLLRKLNIFMFLYLVMISVFFPMNSQRLREFMEYYTINNIHYENTALWMRKNIPAGQTIYHSQWSDSPAFICLNPKNNYILVLDPIYMFYRYPRTYITYQKLLRGQVSKPEEALKKVFKINYGYTRKDTSLYSQIIRRPKHFNILYQDDIGVVFELGPSPRKRPLKRPVI